MTSKVSVSVLTESSNPGVSMSVTRLPRQVKGDVVCTACVQNIKLDPVLKFEPLMRLINCYRP